VDIDDTEVDNDFTAVDVLVDSVLHCVEMELKPVDTLPEMELNPVDNEAYDVDMLCEIDVTEVDQLLTVDPMVEIVVEVDVDRELMLVDAELDTVNNCPPLMASMLPTAMFPSFRLTRFLPEKLTFPFEKAMLFPVNVMPVVLLMEIELALEPVPALSTTPLKPPAQ